MTGDLLALRPDGSAVWRDAQGYAHTAPAGAWVLIPGSAQILLKRS